MTKIRKKKIIGWSIFYLCIILMGVIFAFAKGNTEKQEINAKELQAGSEKTQSEEAADKDSKNVVTALDEDSSGMIYLQADANGSLTGEDANTKVPVSVNVTYYLDGKEISAKDIAGKTGAVKIRFDYENLEERTIHAGEDDVTVKVPFMMLSAIIMPSDVFSNIQVSNGKVMTQEDQSIAVGTAFPGLKDSLSLTNYEETRDIDLPDYVEITADAQNFELDFTANIIAPLGLDELDTEDLNDVDDLVDSMDELADASAALIDGTGTLLSGMRTYQTAITSYTEGTEQLQSGIQAIHAAVAQFGSSSDDSSTEVLEAAQALAADAKALAEAMNALQTSLGEVQTFAQQVYVYQQNLETVKAGVSTDVTSAQDAIADADHAATQQAQSQASSAVTAAKEAIAANENLSEDEKAGLCAALDNVTNSISVSDSTGNAGEFLSDAQAQLGTIQSLTIPELSIDSQNITAILTDMQTRLGVLAGFSETMSELGTGISTLSASLATLEEGAAQLTSYNNQLLNGIGALSDGTKTLQEGMETFDKEGIEKLKELSEDSLQKITNRMKALKEAESEYKKENAGADGDARSYVIETEAIEY